MSDGMSFCKNAYLRPILLAVRGVCWKGIASEQLQGEQRCRSDSSSCFSAQFMLIAFVLSHLGLPVILSCKYYPHFTAVDTDNREQRSDTQDVMALPCRLELVPFMPLVTGSLAGA